MIEGDIVWETTRSGAASSLTFTVVKDDTLNFHEGNPVSFRFNGSNVFYGYVFKKSRSDNRLIKVTAYDQLRYFKNKDTISYVNRLTPMSSKCWLRTTAQGRYRDRHQVQDSAAH